MRTVATTACPAGASGLPGRCLDGDDRVAGIDRALEGMAAFHRHQIGYLVHAQQCGHHRHQVLAEGGGRAENVAVAGRQLCDLRAEHLGDGMGIGRVGDGKHARNPGDLRRFGGHARRVGGQYQDVDGFRR